MKRMIDADAKNAKEKKDDEDGKAPSRDTREKNQESEDGKIPPESTRDLTPFPKNPSFISQKVLSEEFREEIWSRIMKEGKSVREVSAELVVTMERVGAVVRLMEIEKEWERIVSCSPDRNFPSKDLYDDLLKNRLVFKTTTWLHNSRMRASLKFYFLFYHF